MCTGEIGGGLSHDALSTREWVYEADKQAELAVGRVRHRRLRVVLGSEEDL
jgi:hypothetical protein